MLGLKSAIGVVRDWLPEVADGGALDWGTNGTTDASESMDCFRLRSAEKRHPEHANLNG